MRRRLFKGVGAALLGLALLLAVALGSVLGTQGGSRWLLDRVPGLQVDNFAGRLGGAWQAEAVRWQQDGLRVQLQQLDLVWSPLCLLRLTLCLDRLHLQQVAVTLPDSGDASAAPLSLPSLKLPLRLQLGDIRLGELSLDGQAQLSDLELIASWNEQGIELQRLTLRRDDLRLDLSGKLTPQGDWPLALAGQLQLPEVDGKPWQIVLQVDGELQRSLQLTADSSGYLDARLEGQVEALAAHLPAELRLTSRDFQASRALPATLRLQQLELRAQGDLASGYQIDGDARLAAEQAPMPVQLRGRLDATGAVIEQLQIAAAAQQHLQLAGRLDWRETLLIETTLDWQDFPWQRLYPLDEPPPVVVQQLQAEISYSAGNYLGHFAAQLQGPAGDFSLSSPFSGDFEQISLPQLQLAAGQGRVEGLLKLGFAAGIDWQAMLQLSALNPGYWLAEMPGQLAGPLYSRGRFSAGQLQAQADIDLTGRLRGQPAQLQVQGGGSGQQWQLERLLLRLGDNRISAQGALEQRLRGQLELALPRLGQLWPGLQGQLQGQLTMAGTLQAPQGQLALSGERLAFGDPSLRRLQLDATLDARQQARIGLNLRGIRIGDTYLGRLQADGRGDQVRQALDIDLQGPLLQLALALDGRLSEQGDWRGRIASGRMQSAGQDWQLQQAASLERLASGRLSLGAHCWQAADASLCGGQQRLMPQPSLDWRLENFPLASLQPWLPADFAWQGRLDGQLKLDLPASGPTGRIVLDAGAGTLRIRQDEQQWLDFPYDSLRLDSNLRPRRVDSELRFVSRRLGELALQAQIDPRPASKPVTGEFRLSGFDLAVLRPFVPLAETLEGRLQGSGQLAGPLLAPQINGQLRLDNGELAGSALPLSLENLQLQALIAGEQLQLSGSWHSGEQGRAQLDGDLRWASGLSGELAVQGQRLPVKVEPYAELEVTPDLRMQLHAGQLALRGKVGVPRGLISVRELPPSTVKVSADARVAGREVTEAEQNLGIAMDVEVEVGQEQLAFRGFGLSADLRGRVQVGDNLDTRGELELLNGRYRAYGQRLSMRRARLLFTGPIDQPFLDVEAVRRVDTVVAGIRLSGSAAQPTTTVFAEPAMSQEQALSYLVLGRPLGQSSGDNNMLGQAALALGLAGSGSLTTTLARRLGIADFQLDTEGSGVTTSVVASGTLTERLSLRYGVGVFEPASTIALRYQLSRRLYLEAASGLASSLDLFYRRDF